MEGRTSKKIFFTKHAEEKLARKDIKKFKVSKYLIMRIIRKSKSSLRTKYGDYVAVASINSRHAIRIIYAKISIGTKVITFHIARRGRYEN